MESSSLTSGWSARTAWLLIAATALGCAATAVAPVGSELWAPLLSESMALAILGWAVLGLRSVPGRSAWAWIVGSIGVWILADIVWDVYAQVNGEPPDVSIADALYLLGYPAIVIGIVRLLRLRSPQRNAEGWIDGVAMGISALLVAWEFLIVPSHKTDSSMFSQLVSAGYPVGNVLLVAAMGWLAFTPGRPSRSLHLLLVFGVSILVTDLTFAIATNLEAAGVLRVSNALGPLQYLLVALAVRHPSVGDASEPIHQVGVRTNPIRLVMLGSTLYVVPVLMFLKFGNSVGGIGEVVVGLGGTTCLATLVVARFILVIRDREAMQNAASFRAFHDELTGLANRRLLVEHIDLARHRQSRNGNPYAVLFVDLDRFKSVNDTFGHAMGDQVLAAAGRSLQRSVRPNDIVARIGGDEFAVLCEDLTDPAIANGIAERIVANMSADLPDEAALVGASVGIAFASPTGPEIADAEALLHRADLAMYQVKGDGGQAWRIFDDELRQWSQAQRSGDAAALARAGG